MRGVYRPELATVVAETGVVVLRPGEETQTSVTACMSDDSFYDIAKAKVTYRSNNPAVVTVSEDGRVKATGVGAVTVFADVTVEGKTLSGSFPLKVMPDLTPASVTVNGKKIPGFLNEVKAYSYLLKNKAKIPVVAASAAGEGISVEIEQARGSRGRPSFSSSTTSPSKRTAIISISMSLRGVMSSTRSPWVRSGNGSGRILRR